MKKIFYILILIPFLFISCGKKNLNAPQDASLQKNTGEIKSNSSELIMSKGLPEDFPKDVPKPVNSEPKGFFKSSDGTMVSFTCNSAFKELTDNIINEFKKNGFEQAKSDDSIFEDKLFVSDFTKDNRKINLIVTKDESTQKLNIVLTY